MLSETKALLARLQASMLCSQVAEYAAHCRVCLQCGVLQPLKDRRPRWLQTLFGTVEVEAPRFKVCRCGPSAPMVEARTFSPVCALLTTRCTPGLERVQAELGAHTSFGTRRGLWTACCLSRVQTRRACATALTRSPCGSRRPAGRPLRRSRLSGTRRTRPQQRMNTGPSSCSTAPTYVQCPVTRFGTSRRSAARSSMRANATRRFALVRSVAEQPHALLRAALQGQGWREGDTVTAISDGDPALPALCDRPRAARWSPSSTGSIFPCACRTSSRSCAAYVPSSRRPLPRSTMLRSTWNDCGICSGMAITTRRARPWAGS